MGSGGVSADGGDDALQKGCSGRPRVIARQRAHAELPLLVGPGVAWERERAWGARMAWGTGARALSVVWAAGVLYEYKGLCYPHKAWLFHAHTVAAAAVVVAAVWGTTHSQSGAKGTTVHERRRLLSRHRNYMQWAVGGSVLTAGTMLYKKAVQGDLGLLLVSGRMPSSHSWLALAWLGPVVLLLGISGLIVHRGAGSDDHRPHPLLETVSKAVFGSLGSARKALTPWHRNSGLIGTTVLLVAAAYGLTEKNDIHFRKQLAYLLAMVWGCLVAQKLS